MRPRLRSWLKRVYSREGFRGPVMTLLSGTAITLILSYLAVPVLTRLFTPEEFGISDYFVMIVSVLTTFASLRYEDAIMLPDEDERAASIFWLAAVLSCFVAALVAVASFWSQEISQLLRVESAAPWLWMLAPTLLFLRFSKLTELWLIRRKSFRMVTGGEFSNKTTMLSVRVGLGLGTNLGAGGLIGGFFAAQVVTAAFYATVLRRHARKLFHSRVSRADLKRTAKRYRRFPLFSMPSAFLNSVVSRLPILLLPVYFSMETVGLFGRAFVALAVPLGLIGMAISHVFHAHAAEAIRSRKLEDLTRTVHARLVMIGMFPTVLLMVAAPDLFAFVFGPEWRVAGDYERYVAFWFFAGAVASPLTRLFDVLERQRTELVLSVIMFVALIVALIIGGSSGNVLLTMGLIGAVGVAVRILHIGTMLRLAGVRLNDALRPYLRYLLVSIPLAAPVFLVRDLVPLWGIAVTAAICGLAYLAVAYRWDGISGERGTP